MRWTLEQPAAEKSSNRVSEIGVPALIETVVPVTVVAIDSISERSLRGTAGEQATPDSEPGTSARPTGPNSDPRDVACSAALVPLLAPIGGED